MTTKDQILAITDELSEKLIEKNNAYGDSALPPIHVFSSASAEHRIRQRIDDKLNRIKSGGGYVEAKDTLLGLAGDLILLIITRDGSHDLQEHIRKGAPPNHSSHSATEDSEGYFAYYS